VAAEDVLLEIKNKSFVITQKNNKRMAALSTTDVKVEAKEPIVIKFNENYKASHVYAYEAATETQLLDAVKDEEKKNTKGPIHIWFPYFTCAGKFVHLFEPKNGALRTYRYRCNITENDGIMYVQHYKWNNPDLADKVPEPFTAIGGVTVLIVDQNDKVLFIKERDRFDGKWKFPGGALELGETYVDAAIREVVEELRIKEDQLVLTDTCIVGGYMQGAARPGRINDTFVCLTARIPVAAEQLTINLDPSELSHTKWITSEEAVEYSSNIEAHEGEYLKNCLKYLQAYYKGQKLRVTLKKAGFKDKTTGRTVGSHYLF